jgi:hypothetical protein
MSKVEGKVEGQTNDAKTSDAKKLALRIKTLEMELRQSISKKEHHEITSKLEKQIDSLETELDRAREDNQKTIPLNKQISGVEQLISSLTKVTNGQGKTLDSLEEQASARGKALAAQGKAIDAIASKLAQGTVPSQVYLNSLSKIRELEEEKRGMVRRFDYNSLEAKCEDLSRQMGNMVPAADYASLKEKFDDATRQIGNMVPASDFAALKLKAEELEGTISSMVPREKLTSSESRVSELEARLAEHVPQSIYDDLVSRVVSLAEAVTGGGLPPEETKAEPQTEAQTEEVTGESFPQPATSPEQAVEPVVEPIVEPVVEAPAPEVPAAAAVDVPVAAPEPVTPVAEVVVAVAAPEIPAPAPEVREIASQLAELGSQAEEAKGPDVIATPAADVSTLTFSGTDIVVKTGQEFVQAIGKLPVSILETDVKSGAIENWFAGPLADGLTAQSLRGIRAFGAVGEDLRSQVASAAAKYAAAPTVEQAPAPTLVVMSDSTETVTDGSETSI